MERDQITLAAILKNPEIENILNVFVKIKNLFYNNKK